MTHHFAAVFADNSITNTQTQSRSLAHFLGSKERIKNTIGMSDSDSVIAERNLDKGIATGARNLDAWGPSNLVDRIVRIIQNVEEHLLELVRVPDDLG